MNSPAPCWAATRSFRSVKILQQQGTATGRDIRDVFVRDKGMNRRQSLRAIRGPPLPASRASKGKWASMGLQMSRLGHLTFTTTNLLLYLNCTQKESLIAQIIVLFLQNLLLLASFTTSILLNSERTSKRRMDSNWIKTIKTDLIQLIPSCTREERSKVQLVYCF